MMVERYPNLKEEVGSSIPGCDISSLLDKKLPGGEFLIYFGDVLSAFYLKFKKIQLVTCYDILVGGCVCVCLFFFFLVIVIIIIIILCFEINTAISSKMIVDFHEVLNFKWLFLKLDHFIYN